MAAKPLEFHPAAFEEFEAAVTWYLERSQIVAARFVAEVDRAIGLVVSSPERWPSGEYATRKFVLRRFPFVVVYRERKRLFRCWRSLTVAGGRETGKGGFNAMGLTPEISMQCCDFQVVIEKEPADEGYFAYSPTLPGCFSNGKTIEEIRRNMQEAIDQHVASLLAHGRPVFEP
jgi:predicted RNase H-like HicB family nuclease